MSKLYDSKMRRIVLIGNGGHSRVVGEVLSLNDLRDFDHVESEKELDGCSPKGYVLVNGVGRRGAHRKVFCGLVAKDFLFLPGLVHPAAILSGNSHVSEGTVVMAGAVIQGGCKIGFNVILNTRASIDHDCVVENHVHVAPGATVCGGVTIGEEAMIGAGAVVLPGAEVPTGHLVPAGSVYPPEKGPYAWRGGIRLDSVGQ